MIYTEVAIYLVLKKTSCFQDFLAVEKKIIKLNVFMHCVHKPTSTVLLLFTANTVQESIPVQENIEVPVAMNRDGFKWKFNYYLKVMLVFATYKNNTSYVWCSFIYWWCLLIAL